MNINSLDLFASTVLLLLAVVAPLIGVWDFRRLMRWTGEGRTDARIQTYNWILVMEWSMTLGLLAWWFAAGREALTLGLVPAAAGWQWLAIGLGLAATLAMLVQMVVVLRNRENLEQMRDSMGDLAQLAPQTPEENRRFGFVAVTAGICEEILYRGLLLATLTPVIGVWPAVAATSVIFGLGHLYQGWVGVAKTGVVGLVMALLTVFSGSLFVAILLHAVVDLTSGRLMRAALLTVPERAEPEPQ